MEPPAINTQAAKIKGTTGSSWTVHPCALLCHTYLIILPDTENQMPPRHHDVLEKKWNMKYCLCSHNFVGRVSQMTNQKTWQDTILLAWGTKNVYGSPTDGELILQGKNQKKASDNCRIGALRHEKKGKNILGWGVNIIKGLGSQRGRHIKIISVNRI